MGEKPTQSRFVPICQLSQCDAPRQEAGGFVGKWLIAGVKAFRKLSHRHDVWRKEDHAMTSGFFGKLGQKAPNGPTGGQDDRQARKVPQIAINTRWVDLAEIVQHELNNRTGPPQKYLPEIAWSACLLMLWRYLSLLRVRFD